MFINIIEFPKIREHKQAAFEEWFALSNEVYAKFPGFLSRRLMRPLRNTGSYAAIVEHESEATFMAMHTSPERQRVWEMVEPLIEGKPTPRFYEVVDVPGRVEIPARR